MGRQDQSRLRLTASQQQRHFPFGLNRSKVAPCAVTLRARSISISAFVRTAWLPDSSSASLTGGGASGGNLKNFIVAQVGDHKTKVRLRLEARDVHAFLARLIEVEVSGNLVSKNLPSGRDFPSRLARITDRIWSATINPSFVSPVRP